MCVAWRGGQRQAMLKRFGAPVGVLGTNFARGSKPFARQTFEKYIVNGGMEEGEERKRKRREREEEGEGRRGEGRQWRGGKGAW